MRRIRTLLAGVVVTGMAAAGVLLATPAQAAPSTPATASTDPVGTRSLAEVLTADGDTFDHNSRDYDILTQAVLAVLAAKPDSPVKVLTDGTVALTAFLPTDRAFRLLVKDISGQWIRSEQGVFDAVAGLGINTVETVLLYHVVPGATITKKQALRADGAVLTTAQGGTITVDVKRFCWYRVVKLIDADTDDRNPAIVQFNINKGNQQIAHGINRVLRPIDLP